jgi:hypothetical protein
MHKQSYSKLLHQILIDTGKVSIDGIGTFLLQRQTSKFSGSKDYIFPPSTSVHYDKSIDQSYKFSLLLTEIGMPISLANMLETEIQMDYKNAVQSNKSLEVENFGSLDANEFKVFNNGIFNKFNGLSEVESKILPPDIAREYVHQTKMAHEPTIIKTINEYKPSIWDMFIPAFIAFSMLFVVFVWYKNAQLITTEKVSTIEYAAKPKRLQQESVSSDIHSQIDSILLDKKADSDLTNIEKSKPFQKSTTTINNPTAIPLKKEIERKNVAENSNTLTSTGDDCVIIVGSFKNHVYANRLIKKIETQGYKSYTSNVEGMQRVGVSYQCSMLNSDSFKNEIKLTFEDKAWQLKDSL